MVTSPCRLHFLSPFPMFPLLLSFPPFPPTMERIWKITCVTLHVICCLLLPEFLYLTPSPCLCFFLSYFSFFSPFLSVFTSGLHYSTYSMSVSGVSSVKYMHCTVLESCMWERGGKITSHLHPFSSLNVFSPSSKHCLYFIKYGLGMSPLNIR